MCMGGGGSPPVKPLTREEMVEMTDNPFENPNSGVAAPSWKPDEVEAEKAAIEAKKASDKLRVDTAEVTPRASSGGSMGAVERNKRAAKLKSKTKKSKK
jgi:hypothetical protein